jgi:hypothetical protein
MLEGDERDLFVLYAIPIRSFVSVMSYIVHSKLFRPLQTRLLPIISCELSLCFQIVAIARYI